jgi:hypothetical protein
VSHHALAEILIEASIGGDIHGQYRAPAILVSFHQQPRRRLPDWIVDFAARRKVSSARTKNYEILFLAFLAASSILGRACLTA